MPNPDFIVASKKPLIFLKPTRPGGGLLASRYEKFRFGRGILAIHEPYADLTTEQLPVLLLAATGMTTHRIAQLDNLTSDRVKMVVKEGVSSLAARAVDEGLIAEPAGPLKRVLIPRCMFGLGMLSVERAADPIRCSEANWPALEMMARGTTDEAIVDSLAITQRDLGRTLDRAYSTAYAKHRAGLVLQMYMSQQLTPEMVTAQ